MRIRAPISVKIIFFLVVAAAFVAVVHMALFVMRPPSQTKEYKEVLIPEGSSFRNVARELRKNGIISDRMAFIALGKLAGATRRIRAGFYSFDTSMKPLDVLEMLKRGRIIEYQVILPEGFDMDKIAGALEATGLTTKSEFLKKASDPAYVRSLGLEGQTLEGYLFPATYFFPKGMSLDAVIRQMVAKYHEVFNPDLKARAAELGMSELQAVTLASLIEREANLDSERFLISAVFHNRLSKGIPLQCDPCVIYALARHGKWDGDLTRQNLRYKDPYNTYVYRGLPPGPIASPGKPSIIAALYPADVDYIYFVSKNDGTHYFSNNLAQHNKAVYQYQVLAKLENRTTVAPWRRKINARKALQAKNPEPPKVGEPIKAPKNR
ncbi:MAG: endolytic transglycosylase MltG [Nitrospirota bacterium]